MPHRSSGHGPKSGRRSNDSSMLIDATLKQAFPPLALPTREFMEHARDDLGGARPAAAGAAAAVARLHARRLVRRMGNLCAARGRRGMGTERPRELRAPARRTHSRNSGARRGHARRGRVARFSFQWTASPPFVPTTRLRTRLRRVGPQSAEASAKAESGDPGPRALKLIKKIWVPACAGTNGETPSTQTASALAGHACRGGIIPGRSKNFIEADHVPRSAFRVAALPPCV